MINNELRNSTECMKSRMNENTLYQLKDFPGDGVKGEDLGFN